ncbi:histidine phosphatase family protein [Chryseobacterium sp. L7]|uniref:Histidine phosphatase family protein n=1 Tax=Chryseobacterium endalhagicum TaxID=2797638 RepID=A0ABS1QAG8_9FLAO|nr:phosphoglycerate mutase family protein [Chryseobacterium endalhagicum]MBL1219599.1 histidine phosphatase family protein [Chryseobacterium endalhagicum]
MKKLIISGLIPLMIFTSCERASSQETQKENIVNNVQNTENPLGIPLPSEISSTETVCILLRHAEKENSGTDPDLTTAGKLRADELKRLLGNVHIDHIYTTPYNRTRQTAMPLAESKGIVVKEYTPAATLAATQLFISNILAQNQGKVVVIVGHSNTVPEMVKVLSNNALNVTISETQFDNIFITKNSAAAGSVFAVQKKFGQSTP